MKLLIVNPASEGPGYFTGEALSGPAGGVAYSADLAVATVAALAPPAWSVRIIDEAIEPADEEPPEAFVALTGKITQRRRMLELAARYRALGRVVLIGGSFASLSPQDVRPHADILVTGELEPIAEELFRDLAAGAWRSHYEGGQADLRRSPTPRWDLYPTHRALLGAVQTTRGCPFNCEFCDVIQYQGRKQRHKDIPQILTEVDRLYEAGFRYTFIVDDNFTVHRRRAREVLRALAEWNRGRAHPMRFFTQASIDVARESDLMDLCVEAGLRELFVGIETVNAASLLETGKKQNLLMPAADAIRAVTAKGIMIHSGVIVGFDHDDETIFETLGAFFRDAPVPRLSVATLTAPQATDLHARLKAEGRLLGETWDCGGALGFSTNIIPKLMSRERLIAGARRLAEDLYTAEAFERRATAFLDLWPASEEGESSGRDQGSVRAAAMMLAALRRIRARGRAEAAMCGRLLERSQASAGARSAIFSALVAYEQARTLLDDIRAPEAPLAGAAPGGKPAAAVLQLGA